MHDGEVLDVTDGFVHKIIFLTYFTHIEYRFINMVFHMRWTNSRFVFDKKCL